MSAADLSALLRGEPARTDEERRVASLIDALRADPPGPSATLRAHVRELRPQKRHRLLSLAPRRLAVVAVPLLAAAALGTALVHGLIDSGGHPVAQKEFQHRSASAVGGQPAGAPTATVPTFQKAPSVLGLPARSMGDVPSLSSGVRLRRFVASLRVRIPDVNRLSKATSMATQVARLLGGYAASVEYRNPAGRPGQAFLELRIPIDHVQAALTRLAGLGTLLAQQVSVQDLQAQLERQAAQVVQLREEITLTQKALQDPSLSPVDRIRLQLKLNEAGRALAQRMHARKHTVAEGMLARLSLVLTTQKPAVQAGIHHERRLNRMLGSAVSFLELESTILLYALVVITPLIPLAVLACALVSARRRRDERRLLHT